MNSEFKRSVLYLLHRVKLEARRLEVDHPDALGIPLFTLRNFGFWRLPIHVRPHWFNDSEQFRPMTEKQTVFVSSSGHGGASAILDYILEFRGSVVSSPSEFRLLKDFGGIHDLSTFWTGRQFQNGSVMLDHFLQLYSQQFRRQQPRVFGKNSAIGLGDGRYPDEALAKYLKEIVLDVYPGYWIVKAHAGFWCDLRKQREAMQMRNSMKVLDRCADFDRVTLEFLKSVRTQHISDLNYESALYDQALEFCEFPLASRWFANPKLVAVIRDPRDQYISWTRSGGLFPTKPEVFCELYRQSINDLQRVADQSLIVRFEDFVLDREGSRRSLTDYLDLDHSDHLRLGRRFRPLESINRVGKWRESGSPEIEIIQEELKDYLYT